MIPPDTKAVIELPYQSGDELTEGGVPISEASGLKILATGKSGYRLSAGSGYFRFIINRQP